MQNRPIEDLKNDFYSLEELYLKFSSNSLFKQYWYSNNDFYASENFCNRYLPKYYFSSKYEAFYNGHDYLSTFNDYLKDSFGVSRSNVYSMDQIEYVLSKSRIDELYKTLEMNYNNKLKMPESDKYQYGIIKQMLIDAINNKTLVIIKVSD